MDLVKWFFHSIYVHFGRIERNIFSCLFTREWRRKGIQIPIMGNLWMAFETNLEILFAISSVSGCSMFTATNFQPEA